MATHPRPLRAAGRTGQDLFDDAVAIRARSAATRQRSEQLRVDAATSPAPKLPDLGDTVESLRTEICLLRQAMHSDVIAMAEGVIIGTVGCTPEQASETLRHRSEAEHRRIDDLAADIVRRRTA
jgi:hypothetical protein